MSKKLINVIIIVAITLAIFPLSTEHVVADSVTFVVQYDGNEASSGAMEMSIVKSDVYTSAKGSAFKKEGYAFRYWHAYRKKDNKYLYAWNQNLHQRGWYTEGNEPMDWSLSEISNYGSINTIPASEGDIITLKANWEEVKFQLKCFDNYSQKNYLRDVTHFQEPIDGISLKWDEGEAYGGFNSLKIYNSGSAWTTPFVGFDTDTNGGIGPIGDRHIDNKSMVVSFYAKSDRNDARMRIKWYSADMLDSDSDISLSKSWKKYIVRVDKGENIDTNTLCFVPQKGGSYWINQVQLEDGIEATGYVKEDGGLTISYNNEYGKTYNLPKNPTREGYTFAGWYTSKSGGELITSSTPVKPMHLCVYAHWEKNHVHSLVKTTAKSATCTVAGNKEYWTCSTCGKVFSDTNGKTEVTKSAVTIASKGHNYGTWSKYDEQQHKRVCKNDSSHIEYQKHVWNNGVVTKPASVTSGLKTYTCTVCKEEKTEMLPPVKETQIRRLYGENRYDTSIEIAKAFLSDSNQSKLDSIIVARGDAFPDALSASCLANKLSTPVLVWRERDSKKIQEYIKQNVKSGGRIYLLGGTAVLSDTIKSGLKGYKFTRLEGSTRFETNVEILKKTGKRSGKILVCDGISFETALISSATGYPILLINTQKPKLRTSQIEYLSTLANTEFIIVGTVASVPKSIETELEQYGKVSRIQGKNSDQISYNVAKQLYGPKPREITLAIDKDYPDGLCGGMLCIASEGPLFLINESRYEKTLEYSKGMNYDRINVLGGPTLISDALAKKIGEIV